MDGYFRHSRKLLQQTASDKRLTAADRQILDLAMMNTRNPGDPVGLGIDFLIRGTGLDRSTVIRSRRHLVGLGYLVPGNRGLHGLFCFTVVTGGVDATPEQATGGTDATCGVDATGGMETTGSGGVDATRSGGVDATQKKQGDMDTFLSQNNEKPPSCSAPPEKQNPAPKVTPKKPKVTMAGVGFVIPDAIRQTWATAFPGVDIDREAAKAFAWCQNNPRKAPKKDYGRFLNSWLGRAKPPSAENGFDSDGHIATDAELIRGAEIAFDTPEERAHYWWVCKNRGEYVPCGVECRPMPDKAEVV